MDISVILPTFDEGGNVSPLIREVKSILDRMRMAYEIIVVDAGSNDETRERAKAVGANTVFVQKKAGYGGALQEAFKKARGDYVITMDADYSHHPDFLQALIKERDKAEVVIASRYVKGGSAEMSFSRWVLSKLLNKVFASILSLPFRDISSGFRLYKKEVLEEIKIASIRFDVLEEIIIRSLAHGFKVIEIPFHYRKRREGKSHARPVRLAFSYLMTLLRMWRLRNSIFSADYDRRAYYSRIPLQRYWHRKRYRIVMGFIDQSGSILDIGCGSSKIIESLPDAVGLDVQLKKLRYLRKTNFRLINGNLIRLPFREESFDEVICSEVIEHLPMEEIDFRELFRVVKARGILVIGTPDYNRKLWRLIEYFYKKILPGAYGSGHITRFTYRKLRCELERAGFQYLEHRYVGGCEVVLKMKKVDESFSVHSMTKSTEDV